MISQETLSHPYRFDFTGNLFRICTHSILEIEIPSPKLLYIRLYSPELTIEVRVRANDANSWCTYLSMPRNLKLSVKVFSRMHLGYVRIVELYTISVKLIDTLLKLEI